MTFVDFLLLAVLIFVGLNVLLYLLKKRRTGGGCGG